MKTIIPILEKIRPLIITLTAEERLALIQAIATLESSPTPRPTLENRRQIIKQEQERWYARSASERQAYQGQFVALQQGKVIDSDPDQRILYLRIKKQYGRAPIPILYADWTEPPTYTVHSPHRAGKTEESP